MEHPSLDRLSKPSGQGSASVCLRGKRATQNKVCALRRWGAQKTGSKQHMLARSQVNDEQQAKVVIIGSGWGATSFIKALPKNIGQKYDITLVSPRNYFLFTALLPGVATGKLEGRSITESMRRLIYGKGKFFEAGATDIDVEGRIVHVRFPQHAGLQDHDFTVKYDVLIVAVGSCSNTFGIKGIAEHCFFFKSIEDAKNVQQRVCECFERAALPGIPEEERRRLLTFVIVGGGPTGVEVAAEIYDLLHEDLKKFYADIFHLARVCLLELQDHILSSYDRSISEYTSQVFSRNGIQLILNSRVVSVSQGELTVESKDGLEQTIAIGACVWATGVAINPLAKRLQSKLPAQSNFRSLVTDNRLRVKGSGGTIFALGDAATVDQPRARDYAVELFDRFDRDRSGTLSLAELQALLKAASKRFSHLEEHARFMEGRSGLGRFGGLVSEMLNRDKQLDGSRSVMEEKLAATAEVTRDEFDVLLEVLDQSLRALPATGQVAGQQGKYLARLFAEHNIRPGRTLPADAPAFRYSDGGAVAYIGTDEAVMDLPSFRLKGRGAGILWRGWETYRQISARNRALVAFDWLRSRLFGRDFECCQLEKDVPVAEAAAVRE